MEIKFESLFGDKKKILFYAHPEYYDYLHYIQFKNDGSFYLIHGAGQCVNGEYEGLYTIHEQTLVLDYKYSINPYYDENSPFSKNTQGLTEFNHQVICSYNLVKEDKKHIGGYHGDEVFITSYSLYLDRTPLYISNRENNLFNLIKDDSLPTTFYS